MDVRNTGRKWLRNTKYEEKAKRFKRSTGNEGQGESGHKLRVQAGPT